MPPRFGGISKLHTRLSAVMLDVAGADGYEIVFVDDAGPGRTWPILLELAARDSHVRAIQLMRNAGQALATIAGFDAARRAYITTLDDDLQHPPEAIPMLVERLASQPECDVVIAAERQTRHPWYRRIGSRAVNRMNTALLRKPRDLRFSGFRVVRRDVAKALVPVRLPSPALGPLLLRVTPESRTLTSSTRSGPPDPAGTPWASCCDRPWAT